MQNSQAPRFKTMVFTNLTIIRSADAPEITQGFLVIEDGKIIALGDSASFMQSPFKNLTPDHGLWDSSGYIAMPGLINAHTHCALSFFRGLGHGVKNMIESMFFPAESNLTPDLVKALCYSYIYDGLRAGVTCFGDHYYHSEAVAAALEYVGVRGVVGETLADLGGAFPSTAGLKKVKQSIENWRFGSLVTPLVAPHAADTVSKKYLTDISSFATKHRLPLHMHLSQTRGERQRVLKRERKSPVKFAESCGALTEKSLVVHLTSADESDIKRLANSGVTVGFCPASQIIFEKLAPLKLFAKYELPLALATDCAASNDSADLFSEMKLFGLLGKQLQIKPAHYSCPQALLRSVTETPAKVFGLDKDVGRLAVGKAADVVFIQKDLINAGSGDALTNLIYAVGARNVNHVMIDGKFVLWNKTLAQHNEADLREEYTNAVKVIHKKIGLKNNIQTVSESERSYKQPG